MGSMLYKLTCNLCLILQQQRFFGIAICTNIYHISTVGCELGIRAQGHSSRVLMQRRHDRHQPLAHPLQDFVLFGHLCRQMNGHGEHLDNVRKVKERTKGKGKERFRKRKESKGNKMEQNRTKQNSTHFDSQCFSTLPARTLNLELDLQDIYLFQELIGCWKYKRKI